jgi:hypothetical protein
MPKKKQRQQLIGWCFFVLSAIFYIASSLRIKDILGLGGGLCFLAACILFLKDLLEDA